VEVEVSWAGIAGVADIGDRVAAPQLFSLGDPVCVTHQVCIVVDVAARWIELVKGCSAFLALEEPGDRAVSGCQYGGSLGRHYVDRLVPAPARASLIEGVAQLAGSHACHRY